MPQDVRDIFENAPKGDKLDRDSENVFDKASRQPRAEDIFARETKIDVDAKDVFAGPDELFDLINKTKTTVGSDYIPDPSAAVNSAAARKNANKLNTVIFINILILAGIALYFVFKPKQETPPPETEQKVQNLAEALKPEPALTAEQLELDPIVAGALDDSVSWEIGQQLFISQRYKEAYYVFSQLHDSLNSDLPADEYLKDFMKLKMALSLHNTQHALQVSSLFTAALNSRSPVVKGLANYHLALIEFDRKQYLNARKRAYGALAVIHLLRENVSANIDADCYFIMSEAVTREVMKLHNHPDTLPGKLWTDSLDRHLISAMDQDHLRSLLQAGTYEISDAVLSPVVKKQLHLEFGKRWTTISVNAPIEEVLSKYAAISSMNLEWPVENPKIRTRSITAYMPTTSESQVPEIITGSTGLIAIIQSDKVKIHNPRTIKDLNTNRKILTSEAISCWRRFIQRYKGDHRIPNAHYLLGMLQNFQKETGVALSHYRVILSQYPQNFLAPYAIFNESKIKTKIHDYKGAMDDLQELLIQYPDFRQIDEATLYLAQATMKSKLYEEAERLFRKVYNFDLDPESQRSAAWGLGQCYYQMEKLDDAKKWLVITIKLINNPSDRRLKPAYFLLGQTNIKMGNYQEASLALKNAIDSSAPTNEYVDIIIRLVEAEFMQEHYINAMNLLQNIPTANLSQEYVAKIIIKKSQILRQLDLAESAITLLRRRIEFIADAYVRAIMTYELAQCYIEVGDPSLARKELVDCISFLGTGETAQQATLLLAKVYFQMEDYLNASQTLLKLLQVVDYDYIKKEAFTLLGDTYTNHNQLEKAALAYAHKLEEILEAEKK